MAESTGALRKVSLRDKFIVDDVLLFHSIALGDPTSEQWPLFIYFRWYGITFTRDFPLSFTQFHFNVRQWLHENLRNRDRVMAEFYPQLIQTPTLTDSFLYKELCWLTQESAALQPFCQSLIQRDWALTISQLDIYFAGRLNVGL